MPELTLRQCPFCDKVVSGTQALISHMKHCKRRRCRACEEKASCSKEMQMYFVECEKARKQNP